MPKSLSVATLTVLHAIARGTVYGFDLVDVTGLAGGTVYPILTRLEREGLVSSDWEDVEVARADKRPPRRYYRITARGVRDLNQTLDHLHTLKPVKLRGVKAAKARG